MKSLKDLSNKEILEYYLNFKKLRINNRCESAKILGTDTKYLYHLVRLADEAEQILLNGDIDLQRNKEHLKAIRRGEISEQDIRNWFTEKEKYLEKLYQESNLPYGPDEDKIKTLLLQCLESHYGSIDNCISIPGQADKTINEIQEILDRYQKLFRK